MFTLQTQRLLRPPLPKNMGHPTNESESVLTEHSSRCTRFVLMSVETIGNAYSLAWRVTARCAHGKYDGGSYARECRHRAELDLATLVWTRGAAFPLSSLESRLKCPRCGSRRIVIIFEPPSTRQRATGVVR